MKYGIAIDSARCMACYACFMACKDEHCGWNTTVSKAHVILCLTNPNGHGTIQQFGNVSVRQLVEHEKKFALCFRSVTYNLLRRQKRVDEICGHAQLVHCIKQSHRGRNVGQRDGHDVALFAAVFSERAAQRLHFVEKLTVGYIAPDKMQGGFFSVVFLAFKKMPVHFSFN